MKNNSDSIVVIFQESSQERERQKALWEKDPNSFDRMKISGATEKDGMEYVHIGDEYFDLSKPKTPSVVGTYIPSKEFMDMLENTRKELEALRIKPKKQVELSDFKPAQDELSALIKKMKEKK